MAFGSRVAPGLTLGVLALGACGGQSGGHDAGGGVAGVAGMAGQTVGIGGRTGTSPPAPPLPPAPIGVPPSTSTGGATQTTGFEDQVVWNMAPAHRVLYSWTTREQVEELRRDRVLLTRTERPGEGPGYAFTAMERLAADGSTPERQLLGKLGRELFVKARYAWPHPWATRMGWPGEEYGAELIRIVLAPEAWTVVVADGLGMTVIDADNRVVSVTDALAQPERIGAIFFYRTTSEGLGSLSQCAGGYREFIVGNVAMIEEWSIATAEIRARIEEDARRLEQFRGVLPATPPDPATFDADVACHWDEPLTQDPVSAYRRSLAIASEYYVPGSAEVTALVAALRASLFEPSPLIVAPGR